MSSEALEGRPELKRLTFAGPNDCWLWTGSTNPEGYGRVSVAGRTYGIHRYVYELVHGPVDAELTIDHLCRVRNCANPAHLEVVTRRENVLRGVGLTAQNARKTHCPKGHPYDEENTRIGADGQRRCGACRSAYNRAHRRRQKEAAAA